MTTIPTYIFVQKIVFNHIPTIQVIGESQIQNIQNTFQKNYPQLQVLQQKQDPLVYKYLDNMQKP